MDLSLLIPSKMRRTVLEFFCTDPEAQVYVNELARLLKASPQPIYRELINLENWGFLFSSKRGNQRVFRVNRRFVFFRMIAEMIQVRRELLSRPPRVTGVYEWKELARDYDRIAVTPGMIQGLRTKRGRPRAYDEEVSMTRKGLL